MNFMMREGIILRSYAPHCGKVSLFDSDFGRIEAVVPHPVTRVRLANGALLLYRLEVWGTLHRMVDSELVCLPHTWARADILFLHHLLEVARFFLPESGVAQEAYLFLRTALYEERIGGDIFKKLFVGKFLALLGVYPNNALHKDMQSLFYLLSDARDIMLNTQEDDELEQQLRVWLLGCIQTHPYAHRFTTLHFY